MKQFKLVKKIKGFALSSELIFLSTIVTAGLSIGMVQVRDAVVAEMSDVGQAIGSLSQSYDFEGIINSATTAEVAGSGYQDVVDTNAGDGVAWTFVVATGTGEAFVTDGSNGIDAAN